MNICVGAQDGRVASLALDTDTDGLLELEPEFAQEMHLGPVRVMSAHKGILLSGGADETVRVYDLPRKRERSVLTAHSGEITSMNLFDDEQGRSHALTADSTGSICLWRSRDWSMLKTLRAHNSPVLSSCVHPSALLALSTSEDRALLMWDLLRGKVVFSAKTKGNAVSNACWTADGEWYLLSAGCVLSRNAMSGKKVNHFQHPKPVAGVIEANNSIITGCEDGIVRLWDSRTASVELKGPTHDRRVVNVACDNNLLISADVRGGLNVWDLRMSDTTRLRTNVGMDVSCMVASSKVRIDEDSVTSKRKRKVEQKAKDIRENRNMESSNPTRKSVEGGTQACEPDAPSTTDIPLHKSQTPKRKRRRKKSKQ